MNKKAKKRLRFNKNILPQVEKLAGFGLTNDEIADFLGIVRATLYNWLNETSEYYWPEFQSALMRGKIKSDSRVIESLFKRAIGYSHPEEKIFIYYGKIKRAMTMRHYPPDTLAGIYWLNNRRSQDWRNKVPEKSNEGELAKEEIEIVSDVKDKEQVKRFLLN
jgi:hypothetical protein